MQRIGTIVTEHPRNTPQFYMTAPTPCPYLPGREERKVFTHIVGDGATRLNNLLTHGGFRRSQSIAYRPACDTCRACVSVRIVADEFRDSRTFRRIRAANRDLIGINVGLQASSEQYGLFRRYLDSRHPGGGMSEMSVLDYTMMIEDSHVRSWVIEYRLRDADSGFTGHSNGPLVGVALIDELSDGLSMVYSLYDPDMPARSLGTFMILDQIQRTLKRGLPYLYLGYYVEGSRKMAYKARFQPQERLGSAGWETA